MATTKAVKARVAVYWNPETWKKLRHQGIHEGRSASAVSEDAVLAYLKGKDLKRPHEASVGTRRRSKG
jgi:hypothetical protein